jgi:L-alanine-DL-glutamate epimerase-like enolase superfamily enzyme
MKITRFKTTLADVPLEKPIATAIHQMKSVDVLMPDLQRIGGFSEMRRVAALASVYEVPISIHIFTEYSLCIAGSEPGCISVEHMPWNARLFNESMEIRDGFIDLPSRPGTGFSFDKRAIKRFSV